MTRAWAQFYFAIALMVLSAALFANMLNDNQVELGPLSAWFAGLATSGAVFVALFNTDRTLKQADKYRLENEHREARRYVQALHTQAFRIKTTLRIYWQDNAEDEWNMEAIHFLESRLRIDEFISILLKFPIHQSPNDISIFEIEMLLFSANTIAHEIQECKRRISEFNLESSNLDLATALEWITNSHQRLDEQLAEMSEKPL